MKALCKARRGTLILLAVAVAAMLWCHAESLRVPAHFQRAFLPETSVTVSADNGADATPDNGLRAARLAARELTEQLKDSCASATLYAVQEPSPLSTEDGRTAGARLIGMEAGYYGVAPFTLYCGRLIYPDEFDQGAHVALVDEQLAVALFQYAEPLEQEITLGDIAYRIVGVLRASRQVGTQTDYKMYVPYRSLEDSAQAFTSLVYEAAPLAGAGGWVSFQSAVGSLGQTGTTVSLGKERMNASMPQRALLCLVGMVFALTMIRLVTRAVKRVAQQYRERLVNQYAIRLLPWLAARGALLAMAYAACAALLAALFMQLIAPVYTFPEWIPAVLVEPKDIQTAFWNVWHATAVVTEVRTEQLVRLRFLRELAGWSTGAAAFLVAYAYSGRGRAKE